MASKYIALSPYKASCLCAHVSYILSCFFGIPLKLEFVRAMTLQISLDSWCLRGHRRNAKKRMLIAIRLHTTFALAANRLLGTFEDISGGNIEMRTRNSTSSTVTTLTT